MSKPCRYRRVRVSLMITAGLCAVGGLTVISDVAPVGAQVGPAITKVEESWELEVASANPTSGGPQINTVMSAYPHVDSYYGLFTVNYRDLPNFVGGGLQGQLWKDYTNLGQIASKTALLNTANETITWKQILMLVNGELQFHVHDGQSTTWGPFGGNMSLCPRYAAPDLPNLNGYTPSISVEYTRRWGLERDRITSLKITRIKKWAETVLVSDDPAVIKVLPQ
ncbi:MAG: hypothetical protein HY000_39450 [Planctomycetes bacterium]|nr:hypothetical protein [Planctomycetota bacterium]